MSLKQLSVFVENKPGHLLSIVKALSDNNINISAMSIGDTAEFGILRMIVSDIEGAKTALSGESPVTVTEVVAVEMKDEAGALCKIVDILSATGVNIEYTYAFVAPVNMGAYVVFRVENCAAAEEVLKKHGIKVLDNI